MQKKDTGRTRIILFAVWMVVWLFLFRYTMQQGGQPPPQTQQYLEKARAAEAEGRKVETTLSKADRIKKLDQAIKDYDEFYHKNKNSPEAWRARFQEINIFDYLANLEGQKTDTNWYDQAEGKLKEMERDFAAKTGTVSIEENGQVRELTGNLGKIATDRLNSIRAARDARRTHNLTYRSLDILVNLTGRNPDWSYFLALLFVVVFLKTITFPFQKKQYQYQQDMMRVGPLIKEVQEKMKGRPQDEINKRVFQVYKENNVQLTGGCLPMIVQMVTLFPVFWMVRDYEYQFTNARFLWIGTKFSQTTPWLADNLAQFDVILFVVYLATTVIYSLMQPKPADPQQAQQQKMMMILMPVMFGWFMWQYQWSSAFMLYWLILNLVSMYQSWVLLRHFGLSGGGGGGTKVTVDAPVPAAPAAPATPLQPMKGVRRPKSNRPNGRSGPGGTPDRIRPRGSGRPR
jgi:YidC/Oxa1 family membrane protein insertase